MADMTQKATVVVQVNGEEAKNELKNLEGYASALKGQINDAYNAGDTSKMKKLTKELRNTEAQMRNVKKLTSDLDDVMKNLSTAKPKELQSVLKAINRELNSGHVNRGSAEWKRYQEQAKLVSAELNKIKMEMRESEGWLSRMNSGIQKWGAMAAGAIASLTGINMALNKMKKDRSDKEASAANLEALTGLDENSIQWLTKQATALSTSMQENGVRIQASSKEILDAYMLVGSAKPELLGDKEALNEVTKEALKLATAAKMDVKEAVDGVTLAMNQYSAAADEASRYTNVLAAGSKYGAANVQNQTEAIIKSGVAAAGANIPIEQLTGSIETLAEKGIKGEIAGTGLKTFFLKLEGGAKSTRPSVVGLQTALETLQAKGLDATAMQKKFGLEAYSVAKVLIDNANKVKSYTEAVTGTNIATEQANINSRTTEAKMAQLRNQLKETGIELMDRLNPSFGILVNWSRKLISILPGLIDWFKEYGGVIVAGTVVLGTYIAAEKLHFFWTNSVKNAEGEYIVVAKLKAVWERTCAAATTLHSAATFALHGNLNMAKKAMVAFFNVLKLNPYAAIAAAVVALGVAIYKLATHLTSADKAMKEFNADNMKEQSELQKLKTAIDNANAGSKERADLIKEFNSKYGGYLKNLLNEKSTVKEVAAAYREAATAIQNKLALETIEKKKEDITNKSLGKRGDAMETVQNALAKALPASEAEKARATLLDYINKALGEGAEVDDVVKAVSHGIYKKYKQINEGVQTEINKGVRDYANTVKEDMTEISSIEKKLGSLIVKPKEKPANELDEVVVTPGKGKKKIVGGDDPVKFNENTQVKAENKRYYDELKKLKESYIADDKMTSEQYARLNEEIEVKHLDNLLKIANLEPEKRQEIEQKVVDAKIKYRDKLRATEKAQEAEEKKDYEKYQEEKFSSLEKEYQIKVQEATLNHYNLHTSEEDYYNDLKRLQEEYYDNVLKSTDLSESRKNDIIKAKNSELLKEQKEKYDKQEDEDKKAIEQKKELIQSINSAAQEMGTLFADLLTSTETSLADFAKGVIKIALDTLEKIMVTAIAERTIKNIATLGFAGVAKAAGEIALITAAFETAKAAISGFANGGYTGSGEWNEPKGIVHSNEFVANRFAVGNPQIRPVLDLINTAQKNNSVGSLSSDDVINVLSSNRHSDNSTAAGAMNNNELIAVLLQTGEVVKKLDKRLEKKIIAQTYVSGKGGMREANDEYDKMIQNVSR